MAKTAIPKSSLQLLVFPMAFLILQILLKTDYTWFFLSAHDPAYAFLFNGLNIALGNFELGLSGFPGTTLQCLIALNLKIFDSLSVSPDLAEAVLLNPEYFLNIVSWEIVALNTAALLFLGYMTYRSVHNLPLSLALQLSPFISLQAFNNNSVVMLEPLMLCINLLLLVFVANFAFAGKQNFGKRDIILMAILMALGVSTKTVFIPVILLPLFAIKGIRYTLLYFVMIFISLALFLIPIYPTFSSFMSWYVTIFTHTGSYGSGNYALFDHQVYLGNMKRVFSSNVFFTVTFLLVIVSTVIIWLPRFRNAVHIHKRSILSGIAAVYIMNILMVAKHFSSHYLYISYNLVVFAFILILSMISWPEKVYNRIKETKGLKTGIIYAAGILLLFLLVKGISFSPRFKNPRLKGVDFVNHSVGNAQRIIVLETSGPFIETALFHGLAYSGGMKSHYAGMLKKYWPSTYFYNTGEDILHDWIHEYNLVDVLSRNPETYIYYRANKDTLPRAFLTELTGLTREGCISGLKTAYGDNDFREYIYKVEGDVDKTAGKIIPQATVVCDFEIKTPDDGYFISTHPSHILSRADLQSHKISFSGNSGVELSPEQPYGPGIKLPALRGFYKISVMRQASDGIGLIVASDSIGRLYKTNGIPSDSIQDWKLVELVVNIPETLIGESINVYLWYPGKEKCYFDHLEIQFYAIELPNVKVKVAPC